jgi:hypothetical protein
MGVTVYSFKQIVLSGGMPLRIMLDILGYEVHQACV